MACENQSQEDHLHHLQPFNKGTEGHPAKRGINPQPGMLWWGLGGEGGGVEVNSLRKRRCMVAVQAIAMLLLVVRLGHTGHAWTYIHARTHKSTNTRMHSHSRKYHGHYYYYDHYQNHHHNHRPPRWPSGKASASRAEDPGCESCLRWDFFGASHTSDSKIGTPVATLPGTWRYRVSAGTGRPSVNIL